MHENHAQWLRRRQWLVWMAGLGLAPAGFAQSSPGTGALNFGMVPYLPVQQLVRLYEPVVRLFESTVDRPCRLLSASDFDQFIERARRGEFDLIGASPHVARLLQREEGYLPMTRATAALEPLVVVPLESTWRSLRDLSQHALLVADPFAVHVLIVLRELRDQGVVTGSNLKLVVAGTQRNAVQRMLKGDAPAAVGSASTLGLLPVELSSRFRVLARAPRGLTPMAYLAHPRMQPQLSRLAAGMLEFSRSTTGQEFLKATQQEGLTPLTALELATADALVTEYYRQRALTP